MRTSFLLPLLAAFASCAESPDVAARSIVFVSVDTLAAEHTSLHGYARPTTPSLERLAESSLVFEHCLSNAPWTTPSYMSQFTGLLPPSLDTVAEKPGADDRNLPWSMGTDQPTLAECLARSGFRTAAFIDNPNAGSHHGFDRGFELFDESAAELGPEDPEGGIRHIVPRALRWLDGLSPDESFFLFIQVLDVHGPYLPPPEWEGHFEGLAPNDTSRPDALPIAQEPGLIFGAVPRYIADPIRPEDATTLPVAPIVNAYDNCVAGLDADLGDFLDALRDRGVLERALLVVSADHGEGLGRHGSWFDHQLLHPDVLHVPLLLRPPGGAQEATRIETGVELIDLFPTLLEHAGVPLPAPRPGRSLLGALDPDRPLCAWGDVFESRAIEMGHWKLLVEHPTPENAGIVGYLTTPWARAWIGENYPEFAGRVFGTAELPPTILEGADTAELFERSRNALQGPFIRLFDLDTDPREERDVAASHPAEVERLLALLDRTTQEAKAQRSKTGPREEETPAETTLEELRKLGYVQGER